MAFSSASSSSSSKPPRSTYDLLVIGGGSAGLTAAKFAATFGKTVCLIEAAKIGGDCTWKGCVPSKTLLAGAKRAHLWQKMNEKYSIDIDDLTWRKMLKDVKKEVDETMMRIYKKDDSPEVLRALGIDCAEGRAVFRDAKSLDVRNESNGTSFPLEAKFGIVIGTGARVRDPTLNIAGLGSVPYWTYENVWDEFFTSIERNPQQKVSQKKVIVVGGGPIGCELSQAISRLGCSVTVVSRNRLLPQGEAEASAEIEKVFESEGIHVICNQTVVSVSSSKSGGEGPISVTLDSKETIIGDHILVATGRVPNVENMGLNNIGVEINGITNGIQVDDNLKTSVKGVFAAGDCTGDRQFTHYAGYQGSFAARNVLLPLNDPGILHEVPSTTFTEPEVASFGLTEQAAIKKYGEGKVSISFRPLSEIDRAICEGADKYGFVKIIYKTKSKQIFGATIMTPAAGEIISELAVAKDAKQSFRNLATVMHSYPSYSIALQQMAADVHYDNLKKNKFLYDILKAIGL
mmetsp:Transcript_16449/g.36957  ORF Transcript_16449/g.36957 Transcript_16449/m.36957 type:complete len:517 (-) Transcript_16449:229-1779(-)